MRPVRVRRQDRQAATRERLIECAHDVLVRSGFHAATLEAIALQAGVTKGAVYSNFASKADLFLAVNGSRMEERMHRYQRVRGAVTRVETLIREYARVILSHDPDGRWASVVAEAWAVAAGDQRFRAALIEQHARGNALIADAIEDLADRTGLEFTLPRTTMKVIGSAIMRGLLLQRLLDPHSVPKEIVEEAFVRVMLGMTKRRARSPRPRRDHDEHAAAGLSQRVVSTPRPRARAAARRGT